MADDVKVKFSGDFSDVPKGAERAVSTAGTAMKGWFNEFAQSTATGIIASLSLSSIFGKFKDNISDALHYFRELDLTIRRVGGSSADFQKLAGAGKQLGVSMEAVGRSVNFFNKYVGQAAQGSKSHQQSLIALGFTTKEIEDGTISAIEVISRLGDEYDRTGNDTTVAAKAMELFGRQGSTLIPIIKAGREELDEMTKGMKIYSQETIRAASETQKNVEKMQKEWGKLGKSIVEGYSDFFFTQRGQFAALGSIYDAAESGGTKEQQAASAAAEISTQTENNMTSMRAALAWIRSHQEDFFEDKELFRKTGDELQKRIDELEKPKEKKTSASEEVPAAGSPVLAASSLQAIGGGDISSIFSGTYQDTMLAQTTRIADATTKTAENTVPTPFQQPKPMPATK